jgi:sortase A
MTDTTTPAAPVATHARRSGDGWRLAARGVGQTLITAGVIILLFVVYELWGTNFYTRSQQHQLFDSLLRHGWGPGTTDITKAKFDNVPIGSGLAVLYIPRFGKHYHMVIVEGTDYTSLTKGPGHYPGTALPGQVGNFAVAGHRTTYLAPFNKIDTLRAGDPIVIETKTKWLTYTVQTVPAAHGYPRIPYQEIVDPSDVAVSYPVPDQPDPNKKPTLKLLTFTSCNPKFSAAQRIVVHAELTSVQPKSDGPPGPLLEES